MNIVQAAPLKMLRVHGGPDSVGAARFDFSTNSNACGPCPMAVQALQMADAYRYPDPEYVSLRESLADFHGVNAGRIVIAASGSEFIFRMTAWMARQGGKSVVFPPLAYGDYAHAAAQWGLQSVGLTTHDVGAQTSGEANAARLVWSCEPSSPLGAADPYLSQQATRGSPGVENIVVWDCAYMPLRLQGEASLKPLELDKVWRLFSPNKALGLTGVRAAYAIAPLIAQDAVAQLNALAPSWPLGAHGVALLRSWTQADTQHWLAQSLVTLRVWKARQLAMLQDLGWECLPSDTPFFSARGQQPLDTAALRVQGIKLRDTSSMGLPGWWRMSAQPPMAQDALAAALQLASNTTQKEFS